MIMVFKDVILFLIKKLYNVDSKRVQAYKEGRIEFEDKIYAKLTEYQNRLVEIKNVYIEMNFGI